MITRPLADLARGGTLNIGDPEGEWGRQSLTLPKWGGLLLARLFPPQNLRPSRNVPWPARTVRQAKVLQLPMNGFESAG